MKIALYPIICFLIACQPHQAGVVLRQAASKSDTIEHLSEIKINGVINFIDNYKRVVEILGSPDSVVKPQYRSTSYYHRPFKYCFFKDIVFEKYNDTLVLLSIDFKKKAKIFLSANNMVKFDSFTSLKSLTQYFPKSVKYKELIRGTDMDSLRDISIEAENSVDQWVLYFDTDSERLLRIYYWVKEE
ncbi:hypothetical protein [Mucilaginibacter paludis]|uniref:Lipoprotein n=1 Tax=Mucilaginibacter paludis DSM 18603 TaxID=714943 RepID=H1Y246_9SPHI|nr:hypothetical protein [Mucilaginibacter paludis]EHQ26703.1 hypothetical protein Mucpa_2588 [Mucilaginibacter paludis DSM 18603]